LTKVFGAIKQSCWVLCRMLEYMCSWRQVHHIWCQLELTWPQPWFGCHHFCACTKYFSACCCSLDFSNCLLSPAGFLFGWIGCQRPSCFLCSALQFPGQVSAIKFCGLCQIESPS
jgi:hypothetical protein